MACRLGFMPSRLGSVQNRRHARAMVSLPLFCANIPSLYLLDLLSPISLRSSQNTEWNSYVGFSAQNCRPQTDVLFCFFPAQISYLCILWISFSNIFALVSNFSTPMLWFCSASFAQNGFESVDGVSKSLLHKYTTLYPLDLLSQIPLRSSQF